jgi:hypothetical protein
VTGRTESSPFALPGSDGRSSDFEGPRHRFPAALNVHLIPGTDSHVSSVRLTRLVNIAHPDLCGLFLSLHDWQATLSTIGQFREQYRTDTLHAASVYMSVKSTGKAKLGGVGITDRRVVKGRCSMAQKHSAVLGIYTNYSSVENAADVLKEAGFRNTDISVLFPQRAGAKEFAHDKGTRAPEGAATGAGTGAVLGGALGWLVGLGALAIPGLGPFIAAGPLVAALAGIGVGSTVGCIAGALIGLGIPEHEAKRYEVRVKEGGILLSVHSDNSEWMRRAKEILERTGAEDISSIATGEAAINYVRSGGQLSPAAEGVLVESAVAKE